MEKTAQVREGEASWRSNYVSVSQSVSYYNLIGCTLQAYITKLNYWLYSVCANDDATNYYSSQTKVYWSIILIE